MEKKNVSKSVRLLDIFIVYIRQYQLHKEVGIPAIFHSPQSIVQALKPQALALSGEHSYQLVPPASRLSSQPQSNRQLKTRHSPAQHISLHLQRTMDTANWLGLLKWTLAQGGDGTAPSVATEMSQEDKKWLEQVMREGVKDEPKRMNFIFSEMTKLLDVGVKVEDSEQVRDTVRDTIHDTLHDHNT
jgi:hypothetical protein